MNAAARKTTMRWLPFALVAAALAGAPAARANCCGDGGGSGSSGSYGTNSQPIAGCTIAYWLSPLGEKMGTDKCGCEEGHTPGSAITCCDPGASLRVEWTQQCTASDGGSTTVFTGHVYSNETQMGTVALEGFVIRPLEGGCSGGGCGGDNGGANQHGKAHAAEPYPNHSWSLGPDSGILRIKAAEPDIELATPAGLDLVHGETDVDLVCQGAPSEARQVMSASGLADIVVESDTAYRIDFYHASDVNGELDLYGLYTIRSGRTPHATWRISNPSGDTNDIDELVIAGGETGATPQTNHYRYVSYPAPISKPWMAISFWVLERGGIEQSVAISRDIDPVIEHRAFLLAASGGEAVTTRSETWFAPTNATPAIPVLLARVVDPDGLALETRWTYDTAACPPRLLLVEYPEGNWERYAYDAGGRRIARYSPLGNAWTNAPDSELRRETYGYTAVDGRDTGGWEWSDKPRTVTAYEAGVAVSRTYHAYYYTSGGEKVEIEERAATPGAAYGAAGNLRTKRTWYAENEAEPWSEEIRYVESPGGLLETHVYEAGNFDASGADPADWSFTPDPTGLWVRATADYGTADSPGGIANLTRREVSIRDAFDRPLLDETWLCIGETNYTRAAWVATTRDAFGRATATLGSDGTRTEAAWGCCGPESETAADGTVTDTAYDALNRPVLATRAGHGTRPDLFTETAYDAAGRVTFRRTSSGGLSQTTTNTYDLAGRLTWSRGPDGIETAYSYGSNSTTTIRGGLTNLAVRFADGRAHYSEQNGVRQQTYAYGLDASSPGCQTTTLFTGPEGTNSPVWSRTVTDPLGRAIAQIRPGYSGAGVPPALLVTSNAYDTAGRLVRTERWTSDVECRLLDVQLFTYDSLGALTLTAQDLNLNGEIDLAGPDRVSETHTAYESHESQWWQVSTSITYPESGSAAPLTNAIARTRLTGLGGAYSADGATGLLTAESVSIDARGNQTVSRTVVDRDNKTVYQVTDTPDSSVAAMTITVNGILISSRSTHNLTTTYVYDALGRQVAVQDARGAVHSRGYDSLGRVAWESDPATNGTWYAYDDLGRRTAVTNALGQVTHTAYDAEGRTVAAWGATYPVAYEYDAFGRMTAMATTRDDAADFAVLAAQLASGTSLASLASPMSLDLTTWLYDAPTGLHTNKLYANGKGTAYTYTPDGKLATRAWARGVTTTYAYDAADALSTIAYSDDTPDVAFTYDRLGRMASAVSAVATNLFTYDGLDLVTETQNGIEINRTTDDLGRPSGFSLDEAYAVSYAYDMFGRFHSVTSSTASTSSTYAYSYLPNSDLVSGMTASSGFLWTRAYESARSLITSVENRHGEAVISRYDYTNDELGRRTSRADSGLAFAAQPTYGDTATVEMPAYNAYSYNTRSEVTGAARRWGTPGASGDLVLGQQYAYEFDSIGNRIAAAEGDTSRIANYTANALNQYTQRTVPDEKDLIGTAPTNVAVTVNQNLVSRQNAYWHHALEVDNATDVAYPHVAITAVYNPPGTNDPDVVTAHTGRVFVAETPEQFQYDNDGNLTQDGRFDYTWNGENRLIKTETRDDLPTAVPRVKVEYAYDHQGRMVWKKVSTNAVVLSTRNLVWDNYNIVRETIHSTVPSFQSSTNLYVWGLDLSGSLQGAGGIGGLLAVTTLPTADCQLPTAYFPFYDANGNVTEYVDDSGSLAAHYEYSPFGETVVQSGDMAQSFTHRFSTKPWCEVTGLTEYEFRKYGPGTGRWLSRDPFDEMGGVLHRSFSAALSSVLTMLDNALISLLSEDINPDDPLYVFVENSVLDLIDPQGLISSCPFGCVNGRCPKPPPYAPEENGCGPGWATWISDAPVQGCSFLEACNKHDRCYGTCNAGKGRCDKEFKNDMLDACNRCSFNETTERVRIGRRGRGGGWRRRVVTEEAWRRRCRSTARLYASAVRMPIVSHASYAEGQNDGCENCSCEEGQQRDAWPPIDDDFDSPQPVPIIKIPW